MDGAQQCTSAQSAGVATGGVAAGIRDARNKAQFTIATPRFARRQLPLA